MVGRAVTGAAAASAAAVKRICCCRRCCCLDGPSVLLLLLLVPVLEWINVALQQLLGVAVPLPLLHRLLLLVVVQGDRQSRQLLHADSHCSWHNHLREPKHASKYIELSAYICRTGP